MSFHDPTADSLLILTLARRLDNALIDGNPTLAQKAAAGLDNWLLVMSCTEGRLERLPAGLLTNATAALAAFNDAVPPGPPRAPLTLVPAPPAA